MPCLRILTESMFFPLPPVNTTASPKVTQQSIALHPTTTSSCLASNDVERKDSSLLCSRINRFSEIFKAFLARSALTIGSRDFSTVGDMPWAVLLYDSSEFVAHTCILYLLLTCASNTLAPKIGRLTCVNPSTSPPPRFLGPLQLNPAAMPQFPAVIQDAIQQPSKGSWPLHLAFCVPVPIVPTCASILLED